MTGKRHGWANVKVTTNWEYNKIEKIGIIFKSIVYNSNVQRIRKKKTKKFKKYASFKIICI